MCARYPKDFAMAYTAADIVRLHRSGRIACLIGVEGGHQIDNSLPALRAYYDLGVRYMTLTHATNTAWADSATDNPAHHGLTAFGREVVREMNRLGMLADLSHVSADTMRAVLAVSEAPVIYSHSSARALVDHPRNVPDDVLKLVATNGGVVMVNFYPGYVSEPRRHWDADRAAEQARYNAPPLGGLYIGQPERARAALAEWERAHPRPAVGIGDVADHIEHVRKIAGVDHVGLGSDFDGVAALPEGMNSVADLPKITQALVERGYTAEEIHKILGGNLLRVMRACEQTARELQKEKPLGAQPLSGPEVVKPR
jgi:membrane dipeptidase